jgi:hypothetical protein
MFYITLLLNVLAVRSDLKCITLEVKIKGNSSLVKSDKYVDHLV